MRQGNGISLSFTSPPLQVEVTNPELYMYDGEVIAKAEEMGKPGLVTIKQKQVGGRGGAAARGHCAHRLRGAGAQDPQPAGKPPPPPLLSFLPVKITSQSLL